MQSSDISYRVYDYQRDNHNGESRELNINKALDVMAFNNELPNIVPEKKL